MFPVFELFGRTVGSYAVCAFAGLFASAFFAVRAGRRYGITLEDILLALLCAAGGMVLGGHLLYGLVNIRYIAAVFRGFTEYGLSNSLRALATCFSGSVFYGGLLGALAAVGLFLRKNAFAQRERFFGLFVVCIPLFHFFGRVGCFLGGCCYGKESDFGFTVWNNTLIPEINGVSRIPVALFEAGGNLLIFLLLAVLYRRERFCGGLLRLYLILYPSMRFVLEFYRGDSARGLLWGMSTSQWISLVLLVALVFCLIYQSVRQRKSRAALQK